MVPHVHGVVSMQGVEEKHLTTPRQALKNIANPKSNAFRKPSCGAAETATPTQRDRNEPPSYTRRLVRRSPPENVDPDSVFVFLWVGMRRCFGVSQSFLTKMLIKIKKSKSTDTK
jgi:hypothetical protein